MNAPDAGWDEVDEAILDQLHAVHMRLDPPPADLDDRVRFAIALDTLDAEVARLQDDLMVGSGARRLDGTDGAERARTLTFDADSRTIMVTVVDLPDGRVRLDGWLAPPGPLRVELRLGGAKPAHTTTADEAGRFVFDRVRRGLAQLRVRAEASGRSAVGETIRDVVTPAFTL